MQVHRRIAIIRRQVKRLAAAEWRAAEAEGTSSTPGFRPLSKAEGEVMLGRRTRGGHWLYP
jgi:hypothetical protein